MFYSLETRHLFECAKEEKESCFELIRQIIDCCNIARKEGILALDDAAAVINQPLLKQALVLVANGVDPLEVERTMLLIAVSSGGTGVSLLKRLIIVEGVRSIQAGDNEYIAAAKLLGILGEEYIEKSEDFVPPHTPKAFPRGKQGDALPNIPLDDFTFSDIALLSDFEITKILYHIDTEKIQASVKGADEPVKNAILSNAGSIRLANLIDKTIRNPQIDISEDEIREARGKILYIACALQESGDITLTRYNFTERL